MYLFLTGVLWISAWIGASVVYRRHMGKPIVPRLPSPILFAERAASGRSRRNLMTRSGAARRCLLVGVTENELIVTPTFPFNLMFMPEIYGFECRVPHAAIQNVDMVRELNGGKITLRFQGDRPAPMELRLREPDAFLRALMLRASE